ncbi:hypothetical protein PV371_19320 [Streptomyces sp. TX20-6-3]|uniref:hypothetical protein n=1 Tax=Streptomyces sp. TX20-6-3 TaxID=3028705 RepID=UPI0029AF13CB|nr:hypothetical protein [Streptomyces sp. TX20-6-3]MDX2561797.1 hypothetical protein [Streptomyces sp. TX20-6-3]
MKSTRIWSDGPVGDEAAASGGLLRLLGGAGARAGGRADAEVWADAGAWAGGRADAGACAGTEAAGAGAEARGAERRVVTGPLVCRYCDWDRFEVTSDEYFCEGCCLPLDVQDEEGCGGADPVVRELRPPTVQAPVTGLNIVTCPSDHDLFQVAAAYTLGPDGDMRRLSVGLRCPVDGALSLLVDDARMAPATGR